MSPPPPRPCIYHITHVRNLQSIVAHGCLRSAAAIATTGGPNAAIGMPDIKARRFTLPVACCPGACVADFVPFYFCPRSVMLYVLHRGNHSGLTYREGQEPIVHLEAELDSVVRWADSQERPWAFSLSNAGAFYTEFRNATTDLVELDWSAIAATDFRPSAVRERKQAEFLMYESFPWSLVCRVGVHSRIIATQVSQLIASAKHRPPVVIEPTWYY